MGESRGRVVVLAVLASVAVALGALFGRSEPVPAPSDANVAVAETPVVTHGERLSVHVSGMVMAPGVVDVAAGSIVADAIAAAGGLRTGAAIELLNLAAPVAQGDQIIVPGPEAMSGMSPPIVGDAGDPGIISLNTATATELENLPGVGPVLAERIVAWREQNGPFDVVEDLLEVSGIGESKLAAMRDLVRP